MNDPIRAFYSISDATRVPSDAASQLSAILPLFEDGSAQRFLDIGCYDGSKTMIVANRVRAAEIHGIDILTERLEMARARGIDAKFFDLNEQRPLPYQDNYFDCILLGDVIEHVFSPDFLLGEIHRLLVPNGFAVVTTPNLASWRNRVVLFLGWQPFGTEVSTRYRVGNPRAPQGLPSGHIRVFTPRALRELCARYDFRVEHIGGLTVPGHDSGLSWLTGLIDKFVAQVTPALCDGLAFKLRNQ